MAINSNIPLGIRPIQQPNMLGMAGQAMALQAATQDIEGNEALRNFYASGGNAETPEGARALMAANPKMGMQILKSQAETQKIGGEALGKAYSNARESLAMVRTPEELLAYSVSQFNDPLIGPSLKSKGLTPEISAANLQKELSTSGFDAVIKKSAMGLDGWFKDQTTQRGQNMTYGATTRGQDITDKRLREQMEFDKQKRSVIVGEGQFLQTDAYGNVYQVGAYGAQRGPNAPPPAMQNAWANAFVTSKPSVNALNQPPPNVVQPGSPTVANAAAMDAQANIPRPKVPVRQPVAIIGPDGKSVLVPPDQAVGKQPATAFTEQTVEKKAELNKNLETAIRNIKEVVKPGGLLDKSTGSGLGRLRDASAGFFGSATEGAVAAAQLAPIADMVLKMVPRFEGPQSNKDVDSYLAAAGKLADASLPNEIRKGAAEVILKLMQERKGQFEMKGQGGAAGGGALADPLEIR